MSNLAGDSPATRVRYDLCSLCLSSVNYDFTESFLLIYFEHFSVFHSITWSTLPSATSWSPGGYSASHAQVSLRRNNNIINNNIDHTHSYRRTLFRRQDETLHTWHCHLVVIYCRYRWMTTRSHYSRRRVFHVFYWKLSPHFSFLF